MSAGVGVDPEKVISRMAMLAGQQYGQLLAELSMRDVALEAAHARLAESEPPAAAEATPESG